MTTRLRLASTFLIATAVAATAASCAPGEDRADAATAVAGTEVTVGDNVFEPERLQVTAGGTVTWTWEGRSPHDVSGPGFSSDLQREGTFTQAFDAPGEYDYVCTLHPRMRGTVVVVEP